MTLQLLMCLKKVKELEKQIISQFNEIDFLEIGLKNIKSKIDENNAVSLIRCISLSEKVKNGISTLEFITFDPSFSYSLPSRTFEVKQYKLQKVANSDGKLISKFFFQTPIVIFKEIHLIEFKLVKVLRSKHTISLGQNFLEDRYQINAHVV